MGGALGLNYPKMLRMKTLPDDMVAAWLMQEDNVIETSGSPSWDSLAEALELTGQTGLAHKIKSGKCLHVTELYCCNLTFL